MNISTLYSCFKACNSITTDTRACVPGAMFIALKGESFNGNAFAHEALSKGCSYVVVDEAEYALPDDSRYILVSDGLKALQQLASYHRQQLGTPIIGITGTNGKTTTKELIAAVLQQRYKVHYTAGNLNNHIGVPLTLLQLTAQHELAVIEMGANHPGEIALLSSIAQPDYGIITNVGKAHLEGFGSFEGVIKTKTELYDYLRGAGKQTIFLDNENNYLKENVAGLNCITYGACSCGGSCSVCGTLLSSAPFLSFRWSSQGVSHEVTTQLVGAYNLQNALAAIAIGRYFKVSDEAICTALQNYHPKNNRSQLVQTGSNYLIVDAYNANPTSMMAALQNFEQLESRHKVVVLGDMRELGTYSSEEHLKVITYLATVSSFKRILLVGEEFGRALSAFGETSSFEHYSNVDQLIEQFEEQPITDSTLLIKGSNGIHLNKLVASL
ncbi:MAG: UDP-N-acetylmuramoyl-tripeptide--D-alanyl-D-alanine ligase [Phocaeicola sp.]